MRVKSQYFNGLLRQSELTRLMRCIEANERVKAKARMTEGGQEKLPEGSTGQARDKAAAAFGLSGKYCG